MRSTLLLVVIAVGACRGQPDPRVPRHLVDDMDWQAKYRPQAQSAFFADGRTMRPLVADTVAQGELREDDALYRGRDAAGAFVPRIPLPVDAALASRGHQRYDIYCSPCHDRVGSGHGTVVARGFPPPVDLASEHTLGLADGELFQIIGKGVRNMPGYASQIPVADRWAIVLWVRVLERARHGSISDVPEPQRTQLGGGPK